MDSVMDWVAAISVLVTAIFTGALVVFAFTAWRAALAAANAAREANLATAQAERQARSDSIERTRPYVFVEIIPGMHGRGAYDVRVSNSGRSSARELHLGQELIRKVAELSR